MFSPSFHMEELNPEKESPQKKVTSLAAVALCLFALEAGQAQAQGGSGYSSTGSDSTPSASIQVTPSNQSPYSGSVAQGTRQAGSGLAHLPGRDRPRPEEQSRRVAAELQHHRRPGTEVERTERTSAQRYGEDERKRRAGKSGGPGSCDSPDFRPSSDLSDSPMRGST